MPIMSIAELQDALDRHGSDLNLWPVELRDSVAILIANSSEARRQVEIAVGAERVLRLPAKAKAPANFAGRIARTAIQLRRPGKNLRT